MRTYSQRPPAADVSPAGPEFPLWFTELDKYKAQNPGTFVLGIGDALQDEREARREALEDAQAKAASGARLSEHAFVYIDRDGRRRASWPEHFPGKMKVVILFKVQE